MDLTNVTLRIRRLARINGWSQRAVCDCACRLLNLSTRDIRQVVDDVLDAGNTATRSLRQSFVRDVADFAVQFHGTAAYLDRHVIAVDSSCSQSLTDFFSFLLIPQLLFRP